MSFYIKDQNHSNFGSYIRDRKEYNIIFPNLIGLRMLVKLGINTWYFYFFLINHIPLSLLPLLYLETEGETTFF